MSRIHVCLVSEQTIPNILGIYHFKPDKIIFCTTEKMEEQNRTDAILNTLKLYGMDYTDAKFHDRVMVDQDCLEDCEVKFVKVSQDYKNSGILVNLTGGTKIMVLGAYNVFKDHDNVRMIYTPIPKNEFLEVYPREGNCKTPVRLNLRLSVEAYVTAYGIKIQNSNKIKQLKSNAKKNEDLCKWMAQNYINIEDLLAEFYKHLSDPRSQGYSNFRLKMDYPNKKQKEIEFLRKLGFNEKIDRTLAKQEIRFLTGDWLSDFCYNEISRLLVDDYVTGIELVSPKETDNEFDVMFTKDNALYIVECKSLKQIHDRDADILYKISALQHDFGLRVNGFLVSTARSIMDDAGKIKDSINRRADQCRSKVIHPDEICNFKEWIKSCVKGLA